MDIQQRRFNDCKRKKIVYWKKHYNIDFGEDDYEEISTNIKLIKKVLHMLPLLKRLERHEPSDGKEP
tara:strand:+ start:447 stop:647 length:201 start_codon:yes stop_codon:yes gene_type:complete